MKLRGILDFSLGNFLCLRGFAPMGDLQDISEAKDIQRKPKRNRLRDIREYLNKGEMVFFPEIILSTYLNGEETNTEEVQALLQAIQSGHRVEPSRFAQGLRLSTALHRSRSRNEARHIKYLHTAKLIFPNRLEEPFARLDGNHRLSASTKDQRVRERATPYCLILCPNYGDYERFSRSIFHNVNFKQEPLPMEHNLKLIFDDVDQFPGEFLRDDPGFGWPYYLARKLYRQIDLEMLDHIEPLVKNRFRTFLVEHLDFLMDQKVLGENDNAGKRFKQALASANVWIEDIPALQASRNLGLLAALVYYKLQGDTPIDSFVDWVIDNNLHLIADSKPVDFIEIFDQILSSRRRTIFVSMQNNEHRADEHYAAIEDVAREVSDEHDLKPPLKVRRVDRFYDGKSYVINDKIIEMMSDCGLLIGNLTFGNLNAYHEIGFVMGKAKAEGRSVADLLLFLDESVPDATDRIVGFNLQGNQQIRFERIHDEFKPKLKENIELFFKLRVPD